MKLIRWMAVPVLGLTVASPMFVGCSAAEKAAEAAQGCDGFKAGASIDGSFGLDVTTRAFVQGAADLAAVADGISGDVKAACAAIATDLGGTDTWSAKSGDDQVSEACKVASAQIDAILKAGASANADISLAISGGQCTVDAQAQASCEATCNVSASCDPGKLEVSARCDPGELSVSCEGTCNASATCEGSASVAADCEGTCSASCDGTISGGCEGVCEGKCDGQASNGQAAGACKGTCEGKCSKPAATATCKGKCTGECKITATGGVSCGANVSCKGGCTGKATAPKCEGELTALPPSCNADANCAGSCSGSASLKASCTPPTVTVIANAEGSSDIPKLVATLETNLPKILLAAEARGELAVKAATKLVAAGQAVVSASGSLSGKAIACATAAVQASIKASASVSVSVQASASVSGSASGGSGG